MLQDCNKVHIPSFTETCCLTHIIEMEDYANDHFLLSKYTKFFIKEILTAYKGNKLTFSTYNKSTISKLMKILIKQLTHFFITNKFKFAKLMVNIALDIHQRSLFKSHPDIVANTSAVYNNVACIYERTGAYDKALKYFNHYKKFANTITDQLIYYNNALKVIIKLNKVNEIDDCIDKFKALLFTEMEEVKSEKMLMIGRDNEMNNEDVIQKCKLLAFMVYNYGFALEMLLRLKEAKASYKKGYEFSISMLGESSLYTNKFVHKIDSKRPIAISRSKTLNEKSNIRSKTPNRRTSNIQREDNSNEEISKKVERIIEKLDQFQNKIANATVHSQDSKMSTSVGSVEKMKQMMKYKLKEVIYNSEVKNEKKDSLNDLNKNESKDITKSLIDEAIKEFHEEEAANKQIPPKKKESNIDNNNNTLQNNKEKPQEDKTYSKPPRIKKMFEKVLGLSQKSKPDQGRFSSMIFSLLNDKDNTKQQESLNPKGTIDNDELMFNSSRKENVFDLGYDISQDNNKVIIVSYPSNVIKKQQYLSSISFALSNFENILSLPPLDNISFFFERNFSEIAFSISLTIAKSSFNFTLSRIGDEQKIFSLNLELKKIKATLSKMNLYFGVHCEETLLEINTIEKFAKFFVRYISILKSSSSSHKYKFGISPTPIGLIVDKRIEFKIGKNSCSIDIIQITSLFYRAVITSTTNQKSFDVNIHFANNNVCKLNSSNEIESFLLKVTAKLQEILKIKKEFDFANDNIVFNIYIDNNITTFVICDLYSENKVYITKFSDNDTGTIKSEINENILSLFGVNIKNIPLLIKEEKYLLMNLICDFVLRVSNEEQVLSFAKTIISYETSGMVKDFIYKFTSYQNSNNLKWYLLHCYNKNDKCEITKVYLPSKSEPNTNKITQNQIEEIISKKTEILSQVYNEKYFHLFSPITSLIE